MFNCSQANANTYTHTYKHTHTHDYELTASDQESRILIDFHIIPTIQLRKKRKKQKWQVRENTSNECEQSFSSDQNTLKNKNIGKNI